MRWPKQWIRKLRPRTTEAYVGLSVAVFSTATQITLVAVLKDDVGDFLLVVPGALVSWLLAVAVVAVVEHRRYRGLRDDWQEVRIFSFKGRGLGAVYPREPTLLLHPAMTWQPDLERLHDRPVEIWFNDGYVATPDPSDAPFQNGTWGPLDLINPGPFPDIRQVGVAHTRILQKRLVPTDIADGEQPGTDAPDE